MSVSDIQVCNMALLKFGELTVTSITSPTNKQERACAILYPILRDELVSAHPWNFAMARADISAQVTTTPSFQWDYAYTLPSDCLRVWELYGTDAEWVSENGQLLTNQDAEIYIRYVKQVTTPGKFSPPFVNCLATRLGAELAIKLAGEEGKQIRLSLLQELNQILLPAAYALNAIEGNKPKHKNEQDLTGGNFAFQIEGR